jgi:hypothetical protein
MPFEETPRGPRGLPRVSFRTWGVSTASDGRWLGAMAERGSAMGSLRYFKASSAVRISALLGRCLKSSSTLAQTTLPVLSIT